MNARQKERKAGGNEVRSRRQADSVDTYGARTMPKTEFVPDRADKLQDAIWFFYHVLFNISEFGS